ncbi:MAG: HAD family phosphatase [Maritimibacter sp.]|nr:HAD family phosphatase [Maritimibacter sp.]
MCKAVVFDLDGCLVDSEPLSLEATAAEMRAVGIEDATAASVGAEFLGVTVAVVCERVAQRTGRPCPPDFQSRIEARLFRAYAEGLALIPGARALVEHLAEAGVPMAIATGGSRARMAKTLEFAGLSDFFRGRGFSAEQVVRGKPAPDLFLFAAEALGVDPAHCLVVEDSPHGIKGGAAAGMTVFGFTGGAHLEGRREAHAATLAAAGATAVFDDMSLLAQALLKRLDIDRERNG